jgi:beta-lactamase class A
MLELIASLALSADLSAEAKGRVGAAAEILENKKIVLSLNHRKHFPMQSVYKLPIGMATLAVVDRGTLKLDQKVHVERSEYVSDSQHSPLRDAHPDGADVTLRELLDLAVSESDGSASDVLLRLIGGPSAVMGFLASIGVRDVMVLDSEQSLGRDWMVQYRNWATPDGAVTLLRAVQESRGLSPASRDFLLKLLIQTKTFPSRIKGSLPSGTVAAHKTGSSGVRNGVAAATNDIGIVTLPDGRHMAVAVFVSDSRADADARDRVIARIARAAWDAAQKN